MREYKRMSFEDRCHISALLRRKFSILEISKETGFHKTSIYRELRRNNKYFGCLLKEKYDPQYAHSRALYRKKFSGRKSIINTKLKSLIEEKLKMTWSPEKISGRLYLEKKVKISFQSIYNFINKHKYLKLLTRFCNKRGIGRKAQKKNRQKLNSIHIRPKSACNRSRFGHWERDGMYGANRKQLLICLERKSRFIKIGKMSSSNAREVSLQTENLLKNEKVLTITNDNGTEFRKPNTCKHKIYYCDAMKPQQRGSVENVIGLLRSKIKRTTDLDKLSEQEIRTLENNFNQNPKKMFNFRTPYEIYYRKKVALII